jgi:acyl carrier protein
VGVREEIIQLIRQSKPVSSPIGEETNLCKDLGLDSLDFVLIMMCLEEAYGISFALRELEPCLVFGFLVSKVKEKAGQTE